MKRLTLKAIQDKLQQQLSRFDRMELWAKEVLKKQSKVKNKTHIIGKVSTENAKAVFAKTDFNTLGYVRFANDGDIWHAFKNHGNVKSEKLRGQRAITPSDLKVITQIVNNPDNVVTGGVWNKTNLPTIEYVKTFNNETWHYIEAVNENKKKLLFVSLRIDERKIKQ